MADPANPKVKIIDFGFADQSRNKLKLSCGTPTFMAPELCLKKPYYGPSADVWAAGIMLFTMLFGYSPFKGETEHQLFGKITKGKFVMPQTTV